MSPYLDLMDPAIYHAGFPHRYFSSLREHDPLPWCHSGSEDRGYRIVTRLAHFDHIKRNPQIFSSEQKTVHLPDPEGHDLATQRLFLVNMDAPHHQRYKRIMSRAFGKKTIDRLRAGIESAADRLMLQLLRGREAEFVGDVSARMPIYALSQLFDIPVEDESFIARNLDIMSEAEHVKDSPQHAEKKDAAARLFAYGLKLYEYHLDNPGHGAMSPLINATDDDEALSAQEFIFFFLGTILAGYETTRTTLQNAVRLLIEYPKQFAWLAGNPSAMASANEEIIRFEPPIYQLCRTALEDTEIDGVPIGVGEKLVLFYHSVNRDAALNDRPDEFDVRRTRIQHRSFGIGEHYCIGAYLARLELEILMARIVKEIRNVRFISPAVRLISHTSNGYSNMHIAFSRAG